MSWPIEVPIAVQWGDMDALGHVNNARYFTYFETARIALFEAVHLANTGTGLDLGPILAKVECTFREPVHYPDHLVAACRISRIGTTSFVVSHAVFRGADRESPVAFGDGICVLLNYRTGQKVPIPDDLRAALEAHGAA